MKPPNDLIGMNHSQREELRKEDAWIRRLPLEPARTDEVPREKLQHGKQYVMDRPSFGLNTPKPVVTIHRMDVTKGEGENAVITKDVPHIHFGDKKKAREIAQDAKFFPV